MLIVQNFIYASTYRSMIDREKPAGPIDVDARALGLTVQPSSMLEEDARPW